MSENYGRLAARFYDAVKTVSDARPEIAFYRQYAAAARGPILEPMCGSGRILLPLLAEGFPIEGFDASEEMLEALRARHARSSSVKPPVWRQFAQHFEATKTYALIIVPFGSWGLIVDAQERAQALRALHKAVAVGGTIVCEIDMVASEAARAGEVVAYEESCRLSEEEELHVSMQSLFDAGTALYRALSRYTLWRGGVCVAQEEELFTQYVFTPAIFERELAAAGFLVVGRYGDYDKKAAEPDAPRVVYECVRAC